MFNYDSKFSNEVRIEIEKVKHNPSMYRDTTLNFLFFLGFTGIILSLLLFFSYSMLGGTGEENILKLLGFIFFGSIISFILGHLTINRVRNKFCKFIYYGKLSDIFDNLNDPSIIKRKQQIMFEYETYKFLRGETILNIVLDMVYSNERAKLISKDPILNEIVNLK